MNISVKYTDTDSKPITLQQAEILKIYNKEIYVSGNLKKVEKYRFEKFGDDNIILEAGEYYLDSNEDLQNVIDEYANTAYAWIFYYDKQVNSNGDTYFEFISYHEGMLTSKCRKVTNNEGLEIASCEVDLETNQELGKTKYFYGDMDTFRRIDYDYPYLTVCYNDDDEEETNDIKYIAVYDEMYYTVADFLLSPEADIFHWNNFPYYHNFLPMLSLPD